MDIKNNGNILNLALLSQLLTTQPPSLLCKLRNNNLLFNDKDKLNFYKSYGNTLVLKLIPSYQHVSLLHIPRLDQRTQQELNSIIYNDRITSLNGDSILKYNTVFDNVVLNTITLDFVKHCLSDICNNNLANSTHPKITELINVLSELKIIMETNKVEFFSLGDLTNYSILEITKDNKLKSEEKIDKLLKLISYE